MALKRTGKPTLLKPGFGSIQNYMTLKRSARYICKCDCFGSIQNYMALKPRNRFYPLPLALHTLVLNRTLAS